MNATEQFTELQNRLLGFYGVNAHSEYVELTRPAMRAHVLEAGAGEPLVVLHGGDGEAVNWAPTMARLQEWAHVFAVDRPGFGLSDAFDYRGVNLRAHAEDFVTSLLDASHLDSATLVGGSAGGFFALAATLKHPRRVRRLVLVGYAVGMMRELPFPLATDLRHSGPGKAVREGTADSRSSEETISADVPCGPREVAYPLFRNSHRRNHAALLARRADGYSDLGRSAAQIRESVGSAR